MFRDLKAREIDCRASTVKEKGCSVLLYKDARCDMNILDETVGAYNWKREHSRDNANCTVSLWNDGMGQWISKEDTGTESMTEKQKGQASDSFKRACFNWGIGRELYTSPFIWVTLDSSETFKKGDKYSTYEKFFVKEIVIEDKVIKSVVIVDKTGKVRFGKGSSAIVKPKLLPQDKVSEIEELAELKGAMVSNILTAYKIKALNELTGVQASAVMTKLSQQ